MIGEGFSNPTIGQIIQKYFKSKLKELVFDWREGTKNIVFPIRLCLNSTYVQID